MNRLLILFLTAGIISAIATNAEVDPKVHKMCLKATDYKGCTDTQSKRSEASRMTINSGIAVEIGNSCPSGFAYSGGGYCRDVFCSDRHEKPNPILLNKEWPGGGKKCARFFGHVLMPINFGEQTIRAFNDPKCPSGEPSIGWNSTCSEAIGKVKDAE